MTTLLVLAHPLPDSLAAYFAGKIHAHLERTDGSVRFLDLYASGFDPVLSPNERRGYYKTAFEDVDGLGDVERLILVFPTWWFGLPAILKGWIDRRFLPGVAYEHASDLSGLSPGLTSLKDVLVVTSLGSPAWVDWLILRRPVRRALKWGVFKACAPQARFRMLSLYSAEAAAQHRVNRFERRLERALETLR